MTVYNIEKIKKVLEVLSQIETDIMEDDLLKILKPFGECCQMTKNKMGQDVMIISNNGLSSDPDEIRKIIDNVFDN